MGQKPKEQVKESEAPPTPLKLGEAETFRSACRHYARIAGRFGR